MSTTLELSDSEIDINVEMIRQIDEKVDQFDIYMAICDYHELPCAIPCFVDEDDCP